MFHLNSTYTSDHVTASVPRQARGHDDLVVPATHPRSSSLLAMGQTLSKNPSPVNPISGGASTQFAHKGFAVAAATGSKLKRAFVGRRKKSEDITQVVSASRADGEKGKHKEHRTTGSSAAILNPHQVGPNASNYAPPSPSISLPPPLPPKPTSMQGNKTKILLDVAEKPRSEQRGSIIPVSPGISSAVNYLRMIPDSQLPDPAVTEKPKIPDTNGSDGDKSASERDGWRKSDSTISHHTVRPGAHITARTSRPVSVAESLQSTHTVVPDRAMNKRLSALIGDSDFGMPEEEDGLQLEQEINVQQTRRSPTPSSRSKNRRSMSLTLSPTQLKILITPSASAPAVDEMRPSLRSLEAVPPMLSSNASREPTLTRAAASGIISPSSPGLQSTGNNIRGRLAAWTATTNTANSLRHEHPRPIQHPLHPPASLVPPNSPGSRQTAISMSSGFAPAGLAKRAVEKMGRAWGGFSSSSSSSGYSSSSSTGPSSYSDHGLARISSNQSNNVKPKRRRTPDAPSGSWSLNSSTCSNSVSDSEVYMTSSGPDLGQKKRGPLRLKNGGGPVARGVVFGRDLKSVTVATSLDSAGDRRHIGNGSVDKDDMSALETRLLPALVVRCAQHLFIWGIQEEGLFRVSGRPAHVAKIRAEFDTGADYDMRKSSPGELDPHAVASVFKAFLRELPEPILTYSLIPYFEEALSQESSAAPVTATTSQPARVGGKGLTLPSSVRSGSLPAIRKAPSLSTLAMPNFSGIRAPSPSLIKALSALIARLPLENRDLIRTVTELIKATAREQKATKMPLSNLLLVFCPSLNMTPPLLRVLCEAEGIWDPLPQFDTVIDIKREDPVIDISSAAIINNKDDEDERPSDVTASDRMEILAPPTDTSDDRKSPSPPPLASPHRSLDDDSKRNGPRARPMGPRPVVSPAHSYKNSVVASIISPTASIASIKDSSMADDASMSEENSVDSHTSHLRMTISPPPLISSSAESLTTPSSSSVSPSFDHLPLEKDPDVKVERSGSPAIAESSDMPLQTPSRVYISGPISGPVQFPTTGSIPSTPVSPRRSTPILSMPNLLSTSDSPHGSLSSRRRMKKPSIHLLFTKRSNSSLMSPSPASGKPTISGPYLHKHTNLSDTSISTPQSMVTAPQDSAYVLDTAIESSRLRLGLGLDLESPSKPHTEFETRYQSVPSPSPRHQVGDTTITSVYPSAPTMSLADDGPYASHLRPGALQMRSRSASSSSYLSTASSNHLGLLDDNDDREDWTQSVLMAADMDKWNVPSS